MKNPVKTVKSKWGRKPYQSELFGFKTESPTKEQAESDLIVLVKRASRTTDVPTILTVGQYTVCIWYGFDAGVWWYSIIAGPDREGVKINGLSSSCADYNDTLVQVENHLNSIQ